MLDFTKITKRAVQSPKLTLKMEIELNESLLTEDEAATRITYLLNNSYNKAFSEFIIFLLRETKSSTWEMKKIEINSD